MNKRLIAFIAFFIGSATVIAQNNGIDPFWEDTAVPSFTKDARQTPPVSFRTLRLRGADLLDVLESAPHESEQDQSIVITLPHPSGDFERFAVVHSPIMEKSLAARFPSIKNYRGIGLDNPSATAQISVTERGMHAQILSNQGSYYIDPVDSDGERVSG